MSKLKGNEVSLDVNTGSDVAPVWQTAACITSNSLDSSSDDIDGGSKCGAETVPGDITWTASFEGFYEKEPNGGQISGGNLIGMAMSQESRQWRMKSVDGLYYRGFEGVLANYSESVDYNTLATFTSDINIKGTLITEAPAP